MIPKRASRAGAILLTALTLGGCVAAAIPAVAGAAMVRSGDSGDAEDVSVDVAPTLPEDSSAVVVEEAPASTPIARSGAPATEGTPYSRLLNYALAMPDMETRKSAMLREPSALDGQRKPCGKAKAMVLIDLDPKGGTLDPDNAPEASPALAAGLKSLRENGVSIAWISGGSAAEAGAIREALSRTGLDPDDNDQLILMRYPDDRKQTRREELAKENCVVAIAGDHRSDFDELYDYLVKPEAALGLERLIGDGWFLVPPALGGES